MPSVKVPTSAGPLAFNYVISTPTESSASRIDPNLPCVLFLHSVYIAMGIFHPQFQDPSLRRFNLIALDLRGHGETGGPAGPEYDQEDAANDVLKFMEALNLPPLHIVGLAMGTIIAIQMAVTSPDQVLGLFLISPLGLEELPEVGEGRQEVCTYWSEGISKDTTDNEAMLDAVRGANQLGFNNKESSLINALTNCTFPQALRNWSPHKVAVLQSVSVTFFTERKAHSRGALSRIRCPVRLVHGGADIAYPVSYSERFLADLQDAGVDAKLDVVPNAPHFASVTHSNCVNSLLSKAILGKARDGPPPATPSKFVSPWLEILKDFELTDRPYWSSDDSGSESDCDSDSETL